MPRQPTVTKFADIDPTKIKISKISSFNMGQSECKKIEISYNGDKLHVIAPKMYSPFGLCQYPKPEDATKYTKVKYHLQMNYKGETDGFEKYPEIEQFYNKCTEIDMHMIELLLKHSGDILNEPTKEYGIIDNMYNRIVQPSKNEEYDASFKMKMMTQYKAPNEFVPLVYSKLDPKKTMKVNADSLRTFLADRKWIKPVFKFDCLYYINGKIYTSIEAYQLKVYEPVVKTDAKTDTKPKNKNKEKGIKTKKMDEFI